MKLVLLFFCGIITLISLVIFSTIRLNVKKCDISHIEKNVKKKLEKDIAIYLEIYLLGIIKIAKIRINKEKLQKVERKSGIKSIKRDIQIIQNINLIKKLKIKIKKAYLNLEIGLDDVVITSYIVALMSTLIRNTTKKYECTKNKI